MSSSTSSSQRSKSGCWTCRLRRKKCDEGGPPCASCESRSIYCHGYGPRPEWKDRGDREREEAGKLLVPTRRRTSTATVPWTDSSTPSRMAEIAPGLIGVASPSGHVASMHSDLSGLLTPFEMTANEQSADFSATSTMAYATNTWLQNTIDDHWMYQTTSPPMPAFGIPKLMSKAQAWPSQISENEVGLISYFIKACAGFQHDTHEIISSANNSWPLFLILRSQTFAYASMSMAAYHKSIPSELREEQHHRGTEASGDHEKYRQLALDSFPATMAAPNLTSHGLVGESLICSVQIAQLEAMGGRILNCQMYMNMASQTILAQGPALIANLSLSPTTMSTHALRFHVYHFMRVDILFHAACRLFPAAADIYRQLLKRDDVGESHVCRSWVLLAVLETGALGIWKRKQQAKNCLSVMELVRRVEEIEAVVEQHLLQLEHLLDDSSDAADLLPGDRERQADRSRAYIFGLSVLIDLHVLISGVRPEIPEIHGRIGKAIAVWERLPEAAHSAYLSWPFCVCACLSTGHDRDFFRAMIRRASSWDPIVNLSAGLESVVERCWNQVDNGTAVDDWKGFIVQPIIYSFFV